MIVPVSNTTPLTMPSSLGTTPASNSPGDFGNILSSSINSLESMRHDANNAIQSFLTGQNEELHTTVLATQKAEMAFDLGLQVRNKVVSAYQEIMKMQM